MVNLINRPYRLYKDGNKLYFKIKDRKIYINNKKQFKQYQQLAKQKKVKQKIINGKNNRIINKNIAKYVKNIHNYYHKKEKEEQPSLKPIIYPINIPPPVFQQQQIPQSQIQPIKKETKEIEIQAEIPLKKEKVKKIKKEDLEESTIKFNKKQFEKGISNMTNYIHDLHNKLYALEQEKINNELNKDIIFTNKKLAIENNDYSKEDSYNEQINNYEELININNEEINETKNEIERAQEELNNTIKSIPQEERTIFDDFLQNQPQQSFLGELEKGKQEELLQQVKEKQEESLQLPTIPSNRNQLFKMTGDQIRKMITDLKIKGFSKHYNDIKTLKQKLANEYFKFPDIISYLGKGKNNYNDNHKYGLWTNTINKILYPLKNNINYLGTIPYDYLENVLKNAPKKWSVIINTENSKSNDVGHWIPIWCDGNSICVNDSLAETLNPKIKNILQNYAHKNFNHYLKLKINKIKQQSDQSSTCGYFAIRSIIMAMLYHIPFKQITGFHNIKDNEKDMHQMKTRFEKFGYI